MPNRPPVLPPPLLRVGAHDIQIVPVSFREARNHEAFGWWDGVSQTISVGGGDPESAPMLGLSTLLHELSHAIYWAYNLNSEAEPEERVCCTFGEAFAQVFRDNPELLEFISHTIEAQSEWIRQHLPQ